MAKIIRRQEIGIAPDDLIFRGNQKMDHVSMRIIDFDSDHLYDEAITSTKDFPKYNNENTVTWININGLHDLNIMKDIANAYNFDHLILSEVLNTKSRPKITDYDNCTLITLKMIRHNPESELVEIENLSIILTKTVVITFQERKGDVFDPIRERIRKQKKRIRNNGTDYLTFALLDIVVDNYLYVISLLGEKIETLEETILHNQNKIIINEINNYKGELNILRKYIKPAKEMILSLAKLESEFITDDTMVHFKELQENISHANETSDSYREILSDQLNIYHTTISSRLNDIMKFLTVFSVVFIPLTFIAGIYGTNFDNVPELHYEYSYFIMWGVMILTVIFMLVYFKKKKWL